MSNQIDTTTEEGWDKCVAAYYAGEDIERLCSGAKTRSLSPWQLTGLHPCQWEHDVRYRIKPARVPEVGDVWEHYPKNSNGPVAFTSIDGFCIGGFYIVNNVTYATTLDSTYVAKHFRYLGKIDLSLLENEND